MKRALLFAVLLLSTPGARADLPAPPYPNAPKPDAPKPSAPKPDAGAAGCGAGVTAALVLAGVWAVRSRRRLQPLS